MRIAPGDLEDEGVIALLTYHLEEMHRHSPPGSVFALDLSGLKQPEVTFLVARDGGELLGCGALKELSPEAGEIKSMRTAPDHLRKGVAKEILEEIIRLGAARGYRRLSLETGSGAAFEPALALYRQRGFANGEAFGGYTASAFNQFLHLELRPGA